MGVKWSPEVQEAIKEAVARGERHSVAFAKLQAGTLPGLDGPVAMPARTFTYQWTRAQREQTRVDATGWDDPRVVAALRETELTDELLDEGLSDEEIAKRILVAEGREITDDGVALRAFSVGTWRKQRETADAERTLEL